MGKKSQVTLFIVLGLLLLALVILYIQFKDIFTGDSRTVEPEKFNKVRVYIESALNTYTREAFEKVGNHGGYIESIEYLNPPYRLKHGGVDVATGIGGNNILAMSGNQELHQYGNCINNLCYQNYAQKVPSYPWGSFSDPECMSCHFNDDYRIGSILLPPLEYPTDKHFTTIQKEMEDYVENRMRTLNINEAFNKEFEVAYSDKLNVRITYAEKKTYVTLNYPLNITHLGTSVSKNLDEFKVEVPIGMARFYSFIKESINSDLHDLNYAIDDYSYYSQHPSHRDVYSISLTKDIDDQYHLDMIEFSYIYGDPKNPYTFRILRDNRIPAMYDLKPKNYTDNGEEKQYNLNLIDLNKQHDKQEGFVELQDNILNYIYNPEELESQAIDPDEGDELHFFYGQKGDSIYDSESQVNGKISFKVQKNTGEFQIEYPEHHINPVVSEYEARVFATDQSNSKPSDYESIIFQHTGRECIGNNCGVCKECCLQGCCMETTCHAPGSGVCFASTVSKPDLDLVPRGDTPYSMDTAELDDVDFLKVDDVTSKWQGGCIEYDQNCLDTCVSDCDNLCCQEYEICCKYCSKPCQGSCEIY